MRHAMIMAGGAGVRLWPLSRQGRPKQLLRLFDGKSLAGVTPDYESDRKAFTLIPKADRYIERVVVFRHAVKDLEFDD